MAMNNDDKNLNDLFNRFNSEWDTHEPPLRHQQRFMQRLEGKKKKGFPYMIFLPIAAAILILFGVFLNQQANRGVQQQEMATVSPKVKETQMYFASIIDKELAKIEKENSPETKKVVQDALLQIQVLEKDYDKLNKELMANGENKKIIHAMITNLQTRITFLEEVMTQIENIKKLKENYHENNSI